MRMRDTEYDTVFSHPCHYLLCKQVGLSDISDIFLIWSCPIIFVAYHSWLDESNWQAGNMYVVLWFLDTVARQRCRAKWFLLSLANNGRFSRERYRIAYLRTWWIVGSSHLKFGHTKTQIAVSFRWFAMRAKYRCMPMLTRPFKNKSPQWCQSYMVTETWLETSKSCWKFGLHWRTKMAPTISTEGESIIGKFSNLLLFAGIIVGQTDPLVCIDG